MPIRFHRLVQKDLNEVLRFYEDEAGAVLADRFFAEVEQIVAQMALNPMRFHPVEQGLRRANLRTFPYHFLFRAGAGVNVLVLRHNRRHPGFGTQRA
jgi:plasmid stabilization system protein ParE